MFAARKPNLSVVPRDTEPHVADRELARALLGSEAWAPAALWNKHAPLVFRFLDRALGPSGDADDLTQEVFLVVFKKIRGLRDLDALRSFVFSVAIRVLKSELRRRRVRRLFALSTIDEIGDHASCVQDPEARQALARFYAVLDLFSAEERAAFALRHMEGMTLEEVAAAIGVSLATVKRRLEKASRAVASKVERDPALRAYATAAAAAARAGAGAGANTHGR